MLPRRSFFKMSAGTVQAHGERFWTVHLLRAAITWAWHGEMYRAEVLVRDRVLTNRKFMSSLDPEIFRRKYEEVAHNELLAELIAL